MVCNTRIIKANGNEKPQKITKCNSKNQTHRLVSPQYRIHYVRRFVFWRIICDKWKIIVQPVSFWKNLETFHAVTSLSGILKQNGMQQFVLWRREKKRMFEASSCLLLNDVLDCAFNPDEKRWEQDRVEVPIKI